MRPGTCARAILASLALSFAFVSTSIAAAQGHSLPAATPVAGGGWSVTDTRDIAVDGLPVTLSPDGAWIAGIGPEGNDLCVWDVETLEAACGVQEAPIDPYSIVWSPDSTAVAFSSDAARYLTESDIGVFEVATGAMTVLTDDGVEGNLLSISADTPVDIMPAWTQDSESLVFSRSLGNPSAGVGAGITTLARIPRAGGDVETLVTVSETLITVVFMPMTVLSDGSVIYSAWVADNNDPVTGIWIVNAQGENRQILQDQPDDGFEDPVVTDVQESPDGVSVAGYSPIGVVMLEPDNAFLLDPSSGESSVIRSPIDQDALVAAPTFGPDEDTMLVRVLSSEESHLAVIQGDTVSDLGAYDLSEPLLSQGVGWAANNTILIVDGNGEASLLTVSPAA